MDDKFYYFQGGVKELLAPQDVEIRKIATFKEHLVPSQMTLSI